MLKLAEWGCSDLWQLNLGIQAQDGRQDMTEGQVCPPVLFTLKSPLPAPPVPPATCFPLKTSATTAVSVED